MTRVCFPHGPLLFSILIRSCCHAVLISKRSPTSPAAPGVDVLHPPKRRRRYPPPPVISFIPDLATVSPRTPIPVEPEDAGLSDLTNVSVPYPSQSQSWMQKQYNFLLNQYQSSFTEEPPKSSKSSLPPSASSASTTLESISSTPYVTLAPQPIPHTFEDNSTLLNSSYPTAPLSIASTPVSSSASLHTINPDSNYPTESSSSSEQTSTHTHIPANNCITSSSGSRHSISIGPTLTPSFVVNDNEPFSSAVRKPKTPAVGTRRERHIRAGSSLLRAGASLLRVALNNHQSKYIPSNIHFIDNVS